MHTQIYDCIYTIWYRYHGGRWVYVADLSELCIINTINQAYIHSYIIFVSHQYILWLNCYHLNVTVLEWPRIILHLCCSTLSYLVSRKYATMSMRFITLIHTMMELIHSEISKHRHRHIFWVLKMGGVPLVSCRRKILFGPGDIRNTVPSVFRCVYYFLGEQIEWVPLRIWPSLNIVKTDTIYLMCARFFQTKHHSHR